jgi:hypothetical protein
LKTKLEETAEVMSEFASDTPVIDAIRQKIDHWNSPPTHCHFPSLLVTNNTRFLKKGYVLVNVKKNIDKKSVF